MRHLLQQGRQHLYIASNANGQNRGGVCESVEVAGWKYIFMPAIDVFAGLVRANTSGVD